MKDCTDEDGCSHGRESKEIERKYVGIPHSTDGLPRHDKGTRYKKIRLHRTAEVLGLPSAQGTIDSNGNPVEVIGAAKDAGSKAE